jgi:hypothetical protein
MVVVAVVVLEVVVLPSLLFACSGGFVNDVCSM